MVEVTDNGKTIKKFNPFRIIIPAILVLILLIGVVAAYYSVR